MAVIWSVGPYPDSTVRADTWTDQAASAVNASAGPKNS